MPNMHDSLAKFLKRTHYFYDNSNLQAKDAVKWITMIIWSRKHTLQIQAQTHQNRQPSANMLFVHNHVSCVVYNYIAKPCLYRNHELVFLNHILQHKQHGTYDT